MTDATTAVERDCVATATRRVITSIEEFVDGVTTGRTTPMVLQPGPIRAEVLTIDLQEMMLVIADYSFAVASHGESRPDRVALLGSPHRRAPSSRVNGVRGTPGVAHAFGSAAEVALASLEPVQFFVTSIAPERLERVAQALGVEIDLPGAGDFYPVRMAGRARLRRLLLDVTQSMRETGMPAANMQETVAISDMLAEFGVRCLAVDNKPNKLRPQARLNSVRIARACKEYAAASHYQSVTLADLCRASEVSERRIRHAFYDCYGMSPTVHLRIAALNEVRRALLEESSMRDAVSRAASDFGFWHLSRFAGQYRALFGESPSETYARRPQIVAG